MGSDFDGDEVFSLLNFANARGSGRSTPYFSSQSPDPLGEEAAAAATGTGLGSSPAPSSASEIHEEDLDPLVQEPEVQQLAEEVTCESCEEPEDPRGSSLSEQCRVAREGRADDGYYCDLCKGGALEGWATPCCPKFTERGSGKNLKDHTCENHNELIQIPIERVRQLRYEDEHEGEHGHLMKAGTGGEWTNAGHNDKGKKRADKESRDDTSVWAKTQTNPDTGKPKPIHYRVVNYYSRGKKPARGGNVPAFIIFQQTSMAELADANKMHDKPEVGEYYWKPPEEKYVHTREDGTKVLRLTKGNGTFMLVKDKPTKGTKATTATTTKADASAETAEAKAKRRAPPKRKSEEARPSVAEPELGAGVGNKRQRPMPPQVRLPAAIERIMEDNPDARTEFMLLNRLFAHSTETGGIGVYSQHPDPAQAECGIPEPPKEDEEDGEKDKLPIQSNTEDAGAQVETNSLAADEELSTVSH